MKQLSKKRCKACRDWFEPKVEAQEYCGKTCKNRDAQRRLRERAKIGLAQMQRAGVK